MLKYLLKDYCKLFILGFYSDLSPWFSDLKSEKYFETTIKANFNEYVKSDQHPHLDSFGKT